MDQGVSQLSKRIETIADLNAIAAAYSEEKARYARQILVCAGAGCVSSHCGAVRDAAC